MNLKGDYFLLNKHESTPAHQQQVGVCIVAAGIGLKLCNKLAKMKADEFCINQDRSGMFFCFIALYIPMKKEIIYGILIIILSSFTD